MLYSSAAVCAGEVSDSISTGSLFGLALKYTGAVRSPLGRSGIASLIAACTSRATLSIS